MKLITGMMLGLLLATVAVADPGTRGKPEAACEKQAEQCMKQCDKEKRAWFFKGEAYESCAAKCEARTNECKATGMDAGMKGDKDGERDAAADGAGEAMEDATEQAEDAAENAAEQAEDAAEAAEKAGEAEAEETAADARDKARGKGKKGDD